MGVGQEDIRVAGVGGQGAELGLEALFVFRVRLGEPAGGEGPKGVAFAEDGSVGVPFASPLDQLADLELGDVGEVGRDGEAGLGLLAAMKQRSTAEEQDEEGQVDGQQSAWRGVCEGGEIRPGHAGTVSSCEGGDGAGLGGRRGGRRRLRRQAGHGASVHAARGQVKPMMMTGGRAGRGGGGC